MNTDKNQARGLEKVSHFFLSGQEPSREKVTIQTAARMLKVSKGTIVTYLNKGLLTRIKERGRIYIAKVEIEKLRGSNRQHLIDTISIETRARARDSEQKNSSSQPHTRLRLLEGAGPDISKTAPATKHRNTELLNAEIVSLKRNLSVLADKLERIKFRSERLRKKQQRALADFSKATEAAEQEIGKAHATLLAVEAEMQRLRRSRWKRLFSGL